MTAELLPLVWFAAALLLLLVDLLLTAVLVAVTALNPVALQRLAGDGPERLSFLVHLDEPDSPYRLAAFVSRQLCLVGAALAVGRGVQMLEGPGGFLGGFILGALLGLLVETALGHAVAVRWPRGTLRRLAVVVMPLRWLLAPLVVLAGWWLRRLGQGEPDDEDDNGDDEAEALIRAAEQEGILEADEGRMIRGIVDLGETRVREVMTPRTDIVALKAQTNLEEALAFMQTANHSRVPIYRDSIDDVVGVLHVRDLLQAWSEDRRRDAVTTILRPPYFVPETLWVADLLARMRTRTTIALVVDEYGGLEGLVTLEDLLEEIVGDIRDEHETEEDEVEEMPDGSWLLSAVVTVDQLERLVCVEIDEERDFDTVGGLIVSAAGRVPAEGEFVEVEQLRFEIVKADPRRIYRVRVRKPSLESTG